MRHISVEIASSIFATTTSRQRRILAVYSILDTSSSSALMCGQGLLVLVWQAHMFYHISLETTISKISLHMICQSYWKMYDWQSEHKGGTFMMVLWNILSVL
jgi:hypothetical protein